VNQSTLISAFVTKDNEKYRIWHLLQLYLFLKKQETSSKLKTWAINHIDTNPFFFFNFPIILTFARLSKVHLFRINLNLVTLRIYYLSAFWSSILLHVKKFLFTNNRFLTFTYGSQLAWLRHKMYVYSFMYNRYVIQFMHEM